MDVSAEFQGLLERLKTKYPTVDEVDLKETIEFAISHFIRLSNDDSIQSFSDKDKNWIKRACYEALDRITVLGVVGGVKQYSENGYQFTLDGAEISMALASEIVPNAGWAK